MSSIYTFLYKELYPIIKNDLYVFFLFYFIYALVEIYVFSSIISEIIDYLKSNKNINKIYFKNLMNKFLFFLVLYVIFLSIYRYFQIKLMVLIKTSIREILMKLILKSNEKSYNEKSYITYSSMINRFSEKIFYTINIIISYVIPPIITILIVSFFLLKYNYKVFLFFIFINFSIFYIYYAKYNSLKEKTLIYERSVINIESKQVENLTNLDKIIYRGFSDIEINLFSNLCSIIRDNGYKLFNSVLYYDGITSVMLNFTIFIIIYYFIYYNNTSNIVFIITLLLLYRSHLYQCIIKLSELLEMICKVDILQDNFAILLPNYYKKEPSLTNAKVLNYDNIQIRNMYFKYPGTNKYIFQNFNLDLDFNKSKLIGFYGHSGSGKSTLCKLILKIYNSEKGNIIVNNINTNNINSKSIKKNITYITQNNKLFDKDIGYNLNYGCTDKKICDKNLLEILKSNNLKNIFNKNDYNEIRKIKTGFLGEKISGGQRQLINVLNGLIYPSQLLILDEPTSNLDSKSKKDLIDIIQKFKKYKKGIIIITHDKDLLNIFDRTINLDKIKK